MTAMSEYSYVKVPKNETTFPLCRVTDSLWNRKVVSLLSSPLWWQWCVSQFNGLLAPWSCCLDGNWEKDCVSFQVPDTYYYYYYWLLLLILDCLSNRWSSRCCCCIWLSYSSRALTGLVSLICVAYRPSVVVSFSVRLWLISNTAGR